MIFELRSLARLWLYIIGATMAAVGASSNSHWLLLGGMGIMFAGVAYSVLRGRGNLGVGLSNMAAQLMKCFGLFVGVGVVLFGALLLSSAGGVFFVLGVMIIVSVILVCSFIFLKGTVPFLVATVRTLYETIFKGRREFMDAVFKSACGHWDEGLAILERYEAKHPDDPACPSQRAFNFTWMGRYEEAMDEAQRALAMGGAKEGLSARAFLWLCAGGLEEALADGQATLELDDKQVYCNLVLGMALVEQRRLEDGIETIESVDRGIVKFTQCALYTAEAYRLLGNEKRAQKLYLEAVNRARRDMAAGILLSEPLGATAQVHLGKLNEARAAIESALARTADVPTVLCALALLEHVLGNADEALAALGRAVPMRPHSVVKLLGDPLFAARLEDERFRRLLDEAQHERDRILERLRERAASRSESA